MNLLFFQPEHISTINLILSPLWFGTPAVLICGLAGSVILLVAAAAYALRGRRLSPKGIVALCCLAWLPLFMQFIYSSFVEAKDSWLVFNQSEGDQIAWRNCRIDSFQRLGSGLCFVEPFSRDVREAIPAGAIVTLGRSNLNQYLLYYLYGAPYTFTADMVRADYYIAYRSSDQLVLREDQRLFRRPLEQIGQPWDFATAEYLGRYSVVIEIGPNQTVFKRIGS